MNDLILFLILLGIFLVGSFALFNSIRHQLTIRKILKQNRYFYGNAKESFKNENEVPYELWIRRTIGLLPKGFKNLSNEKLEKKTRKEIRRIAGGFFPQTFSYLMIAVKLVCLTSFIGLSFIFGVLSIDEYQKQNTGEIKQVAQIDSSINSKDSSHSEDNSDSGEKEQIVDMSEVYFNEGIVFYENGDYEAAKSTLKKIKKSSQYYDDAKNYISLIEKNTYWMNVKYIDYDEITKSPEDYIGWEVSFTGEIIDIIESKNKSQIVIGTVYKGEYYRDYGGDIFVLYDGKTDFMEGDFVVIGGTMKGNYSQTEEDYLISSFMGSSLSFSTSGYENYYQMPVIIAKYVERVDAE